jgi:hypothetical protein
MTTFAAPAARLACALAVAVFAGTASADQPGAGFWLYDRAATTPLERGQFYAGFTFNAGVQQLPRFEGSVTLSTAGLQSLGATSFSPDPLGVQPGGEFGFVFRDGTFPTLFGSRVRVGLYGSYSHGDQSFASRRLPPAVATFHGVNGAFGTAVTLPAGTSLVEALKVEREGFQLGLKIESDIALTPNLSLSPSLAVFGGRTSESFRYTATIANFIPGIADIDPLDIDERLRTTEFGGHAGARLTWQFQPGWALHLGGSAGPVWLQSRMEASSCFFPGAVITGTPCVPSAITRVATATDSRSTLGFRGTMTLGLVADLRIATIAISGFGRYDSHIPGIQNPQQGSTVVFTSLAPARIRFQDGFAYGGSVTIRIALGH